MKNYIIITTDCLAVEMETLQESGKDPIYGEFENSTVLGHFEAESPEKAGEMCKKMLVNDWEISDDSLPEMIVYETLGEPAYIY